LQTAGKERDDGIPGQPLSVELIAVPVILHNALSANRTYMQCKWTKQSNPITDSVSLVAGMQEQDVSDQRDAGIRLSAGERDKSIGDGYQYSHVPERVPSP
jgi:hypothetical protein